MLTKQLTQSLEKITPGQVWIVGAGPGDIGLLTVYALSALQSADVIVYDALINPQIFDLVPEHVEKIFSGKRGGRPSALQSDISLTLVKLAQQGKRVMRLKGGDPFVFGRGGEEALTLIEHGIHFRIVPGITSGVAGPAYAGIPLTHRGYNRVVIFATCYKADINEDDQLDWSVLANNGATLVLYMTLFRLDIIADKLITEGRKSNEPVALISNATTHKQSVFETTLIECTNYDKSWEIATPCLIVVGQNVLLRQQLKWFSGED